ncbi:uncharacterized protein LOC142160084 [Mixophyes fleayi]|uniref:uncharacterized protein LOC142160084 n=1 Tax=Mixophyes fleayi TaxID=3061075 RepID=UPI003F4DB754
MPKCIVDYCYNYAGMRKNLANVALHVFPTTVERIKTWLRSIKRGGQVFKNLDEMAEKIHQGKKYDTYQVCSEHFSKHCYMICGGKKKLKKDAVPTIFAKQGGTAASAKILHSKLRREILTRRANKHLKKFQHHLQSPEAKRAYKAKSGRVNGRREMTGRILNLTLDIIYLLTGEEYIVVKKSSACVKCNSSPCVSGGLRRTQSPITVPPPHSLIHDRDNDQKILELTNKIIQLLTGEEWEYLEGHKDVMMEDQPLMSLGGPQENTSQTSISSSNSVDMNTSVISDCQQSNSCRILKPKDKLEKSEKNALVLCEEGKFIYTNIYKPKYHIQLQYTSDHMKEDSVQCEEGNLTDTDIYIPTAKTQCKSTNIKKESVSWEGGNITVTDVNKPTDHTQYISTCIKEEPSSYVGGNLTDIYPPADRTQYISTNIKAESVSCEEENLTETNIYTPTDQTQDITSHVKKESFICERGNITDSDFYLPTNDIKYTSTHIKEESVSDEGGNIPVTDIYTPTNHTQYTSTCIKEEPSSYDGGNLTDIYPPADLTQYISTNIKEESVSCEEENLTQTDIYTPTDHTQDITSHVKKESVGNITDSDFNILTDHTQYKSTYIKEEPVSCEGRNFTDSDVYIPTNHIQYTSTYNKEEPVSCEGGNFPVTDIYTPTYNTQYTSIHIKEKPVSCNGGHPQVTDIYTPTDHTQYTSTHIKEEPVSCEGGNLPVIDIYTPTDHTQYLSTHIKEELDHTELQRTSENNLSELLPCPECQTCFISTYDLAMHRGVHAAENQIAHGKRGKGKRVFTMSTFFPPYV